MATFEAFDVVVVPFPFTDRLAEKRRPALVLSSSSFNTPSGHSVLAMITSREHSPWPLDVALEDLSAAGLSAPSRVRMKLFTLDHRLVLRRIGSLADGDREAVRAAVDGLLARGGFARHHHPFPRFFTRFGARFVFCLYVTERRPFT